MLPQKQNPNSREYDSQCQVLNKFITFILELDTNKPAKFKSNAIKVIECLKFIKVNLALIAYAVEHRCDPKLYRYKADQRKGVIRDFNGTSMHFNSYSSAELVKAGLENLVQQFESAVLRMREEGKLESFAYQLEYDKEIGCIERRTAKALAYAAEYLSSKKDNLDDLMGQCGFSEDENNSESAFAKAYDFLRPYLGKICIWNDNEYVLNETLIKRYLTEIFDFDYVISSSEDPIEEAPISFNALANVFRNGSLRARLVLIERISSSQWSDILKQAQGCNFLCIVLTSEPQVALKLIKRISPLALEQALIKLSAHGIPAFYNDSLIIYEALLKKIKHIPSILLTPETKRAIYAREFLSAVDQLGTPKNPLRLFVEIALGIKNAKLKIKALSLTGYVEKIFLYQSPELLIEFIAKLSEESLKEIVLPLDLPQVKKQLPYFLLSKNLYLDSSKAFYNYLRDYRPLTDKLISPYDSLLADCIDFYFEGKGDVAPELKLAFIEGLKAKISLSKKALAFLEVLEDRVPAISTYYSNPEIPTTSRFADLNSDPKVIWERGILSWHHYRQLRLQQNNVQLQTVLNLLVEADLLFDGSRAPFSYFFSNEPYSANVIENDFDEVQRVFVCIRETKGLIKIIKPMDWQFFVNQLANLNVRPKLRKAVDSPTDKFVHLTNDIVPYQQKRRQKTNYTHTKKTSTTLLSSEITTSVFGENVDEKRFLVGVLFDKEHCQIKAMLLRDSGTVNHTWLGNKSSVTDYKFRMGNINQTDWRLFVKEIKHRAYHNEVLAKVNKEAMRAVVIARDTPEARLIAIARHAEIKKKFAIDLPIIFYTSGLQSLRHYTRTEQQDDKRAWEEKQKVCSVREQVSKDRVVTILNKSLNKLDWDLGLWGSLSRIKNKPVPRTVTFIAAEVAKAYKAEQSKTPSHTWVEVEHKITDSLTAKITGHSRFFKCFNKRSDNTVAFYKDLLEVTPLKMPSF